MKAIELVFLPGCPYCVKAKQAVKELQAENKSYAGLPLKWINEQEETGYADAHDYYYVPTVYWNDRKFFEAAPGDGLHLMRQSNPQADNKRKAGAASNSSGSFFMSSIILCPASVQRPTAYSRCISVNPLPRCCRAP